MHAYFSFSALPGMTIHIYNNALPDFIYDKSCAITADLVEKMPMSVFVNQHKSCRPYSPHGSLRSVSANQGNPPLRTISTSTPMPTSIVFCATRLFHGQILPNCLPKFRACYYCCAGGQTYLTFMAPHKTAP